MNFSDAMVNSPKRSLTVRLKKIPPLKQYKLFRILGNNLSVKPVLDELGLHETLEMMFYSQPGNQDVKETIKAINARTQKSSI